MIDIYFVVFLGICAAAVVYTVFAGLQATARWERATQETLTLQREANDLLREISRELDRESTA